MTDVDLTASRRDNSNISDPSCELHRLAEAVNDHYGYDDLSWTLDTALRHELARLIDSDEVSVGREDFDVKFTIPPAGRVTEKQYDEIEVPEDSDLDRAINFSTAPVVLGMADRVVHEGAGSLRETISLDASERSVEGKHDSISATVRAGLRLLAGQ